jgi:hypothetical protein
LSINGKSKTRFQDDVENKIGIQIGGINRGRRKEMVKKMSKMTSREKHEKMIKTWKDDKNMKRR